MFVLAEMQDIVRIEPWKFSHDTKSVIVKTLNSKFANKVVHNVGLSICLFDITYVGDSYIFPGDGSSHTKVQLGFFDDILIPPQNLQHPSRFDSDEQVWVWEYETEEGKNDMFMDDGEEIRFRVMEEIFVDISPSSTKAPPVLPQIKQEPGIEAVASDSGGFDGSKKVPYTIMGSISESGLGLSSWWNG